MNLITPLHRIILLIGLIALTGSCSAPSPSTQTVVLRFVAHIDGAPLIFDEARYSAPTEETTFSIQNFRFFISNIQLEGGGHAYTEPDSYHLVRFDVSEEGYQIELNDVPIANIDKVRFSLGIDKQANGSIETRGALDPNSSMAWNWEVGYKFLVFEGRLHDEQNIRPLVYHVGFNENRRDFVFDLSEKDASELIFEADIMKLFIGKTTINLSELPSIKFDKEDAAIMADNYAHMFFLSLNTQR